jgi:hypothetical protein
LQATIGASLVPQLSTIHPSWTNLGLGLVFVLLGLVGLISAAVSTVRASIARSWPTASGTVLKARIESRRNHDSDGSFNATYRPMIEYQYQVGPDSFTANTFSYGNWRASWRRGAADQAIHDYPVGSVVAVHYNPRKPAEAILEPRAGMARTIAAGGLVCLAVGIAAWVGVISL